MTVNKGRIGMGLLPETPEEIMSDMARKAKSLRLGKNLTQQGLASRSGVSLGSIKRFEKAGEVSLKSLLHIALALHRLEDFNGIFETSDMPSTLFVEENKTKRQRGRFK